MMQHSNKLMISPLGESALRINLSEQSELVLPLANALRSEQHPGVKDIVTAYEVIAIHFCHDSIVELSELVDWIHDRLDFAEECMEQSGQVVEIPVLYDDQHGEDLLQSAEQLGITVGKLIERHTAPIYQVRMLGFMPGFPYLEGLDPRLSLPRKSVPRKRVPAGSVGIGGNQTGIYPFASPGGWNLLGHTPLSLFNPRSPKPALLEAGDSVRFRSISLEEFETIQEQAARSERFPRDKQLEPVLEVTSPGLQTILIDEGRWGYQHLGVSPGGAMDPWAAKLANKLVNNLQSDALLENNLNGPKLRFLQNAIIAITGAKIGDYPIGQPFEVHEGTELDLGNMREGTRGYLAIQGGIHAEEILGSLGTDLRGQFGGHLGRALQKRDQLFRTREEISPSQFKKSNWHISSSSLIPSSPESTIRIIRGPQADWFSNDAWKILLNQTFTIDSSSDRTGIRLHCESQLPTTTKPMQSEPVVIGSIQVPPSGEPIVLMADRQTVGGYPVIGIVCSVDLGRLAQSKVGSPIRFSMVELPAANELRMTVEQNFKIACRGIELHD